METGIDYLKRLNAEDNNPELVALKYEKIIKHSEGKTYLELLPKELPKGSVITKYIHYYINDMYKLLQSEVVQKLYPNGITKEDVVKFLLVNPVEFNLRNKIINMPNPYLMLHNEDLSVWNKKIETYRRLELLQDYNKKLKNSECRNNFEALEIDKDGFPRCGRMNMCVSYLPVVNLPQGLEGKITLIKPRNKKKFSFDILESNEDNTFYKVKDEKNRIIFLADYEYIKGDYEDLYPINKAIAGNWWSRKLEYVG